MEQWNYKKDVSLTDVTLKFTLAGDPWNPM